MNIKHTMQSSILLFLLLLVLSTSAVWAQDGESEPQHMPDQGVAMGAYFDPWGEGFQVFDEFEAITGADLKYALWFQAWGDDYDKAWDAEKVQDAWNHGLIPVITWEPWTRAFGNTAELQAEFSFQSILDGQHDDYINSWAIGAANAGHPIIIRFAHEQSLAEREWYPWQADPEGFKAATCYLYEHFQAAGATNVQFMWSGMFYDRPITQEFYPEGCVQIIGTTVLNHGPTPRTVYGRRWGEWWTFDTLFAPQYDVLQQYGLPIMITELGSAEQGGNKAQWITDTYQSIEHHYPLVRGVLLTENIDREYSTIPDAIINWSVFSSPDALRAFINAMTNPYYHPDLGF